MSTHTITTTDSHTRTRTHACMHVHRHTLMHASTTGHSTQKYLFHDIALLCISGIRLAQVIDCRLKPIWRLLSQNGQGHEVDHFDKILLFRNLCFGELRLVQHYLSGVPVRSHDLDDVLQRPVSMMTMCILVIMQAQTLHTVGASTAHKEHCYSENPISEHWYSDTQSLNGPLY